VAQWDRFDWFYDNLGRLTEERFDEGNDGNVSYQDDYVTDYQFDLVGNRLEKAVDTAASLSANYTFAPDQFIDSTYDRNDRLLRESGWERL